jgi:membrane associated rhomboid family serine protease
MMLHTLSRAALVAALVVAFGLVWYYGGRGRWRDRLTDRFVLGVPWGTLVTVAVVVAFYLFGQSGLEHWESPVVYPFVTWSYFYPTGVLTAGIAHGSPGHIVGNMTGTLAFAPIVEYAWGHYPPSARGRDRLGGPAAGSGRLGRPAVRALVVFPAALLLAAFVTAALSFGPGLGFSGAVFAIAGFAVVNYPVTTLVALVASSAVRTVYTALTEPVVRATVESGAPSPPPWASIAFQAHMLGFLLGVVAGGLLLRHRGRRPALGRVFFGTFLLGTVQALWLLVWFEDETFILYRGAGVALVSVLSVLVAAAAGASDRPLPKPLSVLSRRPTRRQLGAVWLVLVALGTAVGVAGVVMEGEFVGVGVGLFVFVGVILAVPALPPLLPDRLAASPVSRRRTAAAAVAVAAVVVAAPAIPAGLVVVTDGEVPGSESVEVRDYEVAYGENVTVQRTPLIEIGNETEPNNVSGVVLTSTDREMWTPAVRESALGFSGNATVVVGGPGWRETVEANRTGWEVVGNDSVYAVDLRHDGETTRSYRSAPSRADVRVDGHAVAVAPTTDGFELRVLEDGSVAGSTPVPAANETASVDDLRLENRVVDGTERIVVTTGETEVQVAERETYD